MQVCDTSCAVIEVVSVGAIRIHIRSLVFAWVNKVQNLNAIRSVSFVSRVDLTDEISIARVPKLNSHARLIRNFCFVHISDTG
jgi:hypothetical protein